MGISVTVHLELRSMCLILRCKRIDLIEIGRKQTIESVVFVLIVGTRFFLRLGLVHFGQILCGHASGTASAGCADARKHVGTWEKEHWVERLERGQLVDLAASVSKALILLTSRIFDCCRRNH